MKNFRIVRKHLFEKLIVHRIILLERFWSRILFPAPPRTKELGVEVSGIHRDLVSAPEEILLVITNSLSVNSRSRKWPDTRKTGLKKSEACK